MTFYENLGTILEYNRYLNMKIGVMRHNLTLCDGFKFIPISTDFTFSCIYKQLLPVGIFKKTIKFPLDLLCNQYRN